MGADMKRFAALAIVAAAALPGVSARAAEPEVAVAVAVPAPVEPWPGFYAGVHLGFGIGTEYDTQSAMFEDAEAVGDEFPIRGPLAGFHIGFNVAAGSFVFGVESDLDWTRIAGSIDYSYLNRLRTGTLSFRTDLQSSARIRAGVTVGGDNSLIYATGGIIFARGTITDDGFIRSVPLGPVSESQWLRGYTFGGGFEQMFATGISARLEIRHSRFGAEDFAHAYNFNGEPFEVHFNQTTATLGLTMHY